MSCAGNVSMREPDATPQAGRRTRAPFIRIEAVHKAFAARQGGELMVLDSIDLDIAENEFVSLIGRSGCGKTTLLNIIAGLDAATSGRIAIGGRPVTGPGQGQGVVFQQHALFPWLTALGNVSFGFRKAGLPREER
ncbi:ATP-binding cassette domain-containing protein, partial [Herbaspirillum sp. HC18]